MTRGGGDVEGLFPTDPTGLQEAVPTAFTDLRDGERLDLRITPVRKRLGGIAVRMLAYNGSIPGPTIRAQQGSEIIVHVINDGDLDATVHWHGLRLENRYDGVPDETQRPIPVGGSFTYHVQFPDPGLYWYHPHVREDYAQELGLYGNILVTPTAPDYWPPVDREIVLTLDDILLQGGTVVPFSRTQTTHAAMGRFGNMFLVNGEPDLRLSARTGERVRLWLTNTAGARVFNLRLAGAPMRLVGGDSGRVERERLVTEVLLGPSERAVVDVAFDNPGDLWLEHRTPHKAHPLVSVAVRGDPAPVSGLNRLELRPPAPELSAARERLGEWLDTAPHKVLAIVADMDEPPAHEPSHGGGHVPTGAADAHHREVPVPGGIEWEDEMPDMNRGTTSGNMRWRFVDRTAGRDDSPFEWRFTVGDQVKVRLVNESQSDHPMHHPFHLHGAGRFLVLARDGEPEPDLVWKDTVLVRAGQTVDILFHVTNPGVWMGHCHIAEHMHSGMMFSFVVDRGSM